jgi:probable phosphoglycerate mutase
MTARLFIVRHGNTFDAGEVVRRVGGRTDLALSASGRAQAEALGLHLAALARFVSAACSPLRRTRATAEAILAAQSPAPELASLLFLREIDYGPDENRPEAEVVARLGQDALDRWEREAVPPTGWKVDPDAIIANWQLLLADLAEREGDHLVVTSNGVARFALAAIGDRNTPGKLPTAGYGVLSLEGGAWALQEWGRRAP